MRRMYRDHGDWQKLRALFHAAKAALRAASQRTGVPVDDILGRKRRSVGRFFDDRDHTTVLHSRATGLPLAIDQAAHDHGRDFLFAPSPPNLRLVSEGEKDGYR
jgi:hypothetical protein